MVFSLDAIQLDLAAVRRRQSTVDSRQSRPAGRWTVAGALALAWLLVLPGIARGATQLAKNGLFTRGEGGKPESWTHEAFVADSAATQYEWNVDERGLGVITIVSKQANDARWIQSAPVSPGTWYRISGWVKTEDVGASTIGAYLSVMGTFYNSAEIRGTQDWQPVQLWVKTGRLETSLVVACRVGGYASLNTGKASFTGISVEAAGSPPAGAPYVHGADATAPSEAPGKRVLWVQVVAALVAIGIALLLWRYLTPPSASIPP